MNLIGYRHNKEREGETSLSKKKKTKKNIRRKQTWKQ